nr:MAG TPA: hypothetical protein [Caudoviricetes sp.]
MPRLNVTISSRPETGTVNSKTTLPQQSSIHVQLAHARRNITSFQVNNTNVTKVVYQHAVHVGNSVSAAKVASQLNFDTRRTISINKHFKRALIKPLIPSLNHQRPEMLTPLPVLLVRPTALTQRFQHAARRFNLHVETLSLSHLPVKRLLKRHILKRETATLQIMLLSHIMDSRTHQRHPPRRLIQPKQTGQFPTLTALAIRAHRAIRQRGNVLNVLILFSHNGPLRSITNSNSTQHTSPRAQCQHVDTKREGWHNLPEREIIPPQNSPLGYGTGRAHVTHASPRPIHATTRRATVATEAGHAHNNRLSLHALHATTSRTRQHVTIIHSKANAHAHATPRAQTVIQFLSQRHVATVINLHALPCFHVALHASHPQAMPFMNNLMADTKPLRHVIQLVRRKLKMLLNHPQQINMLETLHRRETKHDKLAVQVLHVIVDTIISDNNISLVQQLPRGTNHSFMPALTLVTIEQRLLVPIPFSGETNHLAIFHNLVDSNVLIP